MSQNTVTFEIPEPLRAGQGWAVTYGCNCGDGHSVNRGYLRVVEMLDVAEGVACSANVSDGRDEFVIYRDSDDGGEYWAYGSDGDPIMFDRLVEVTSTVEHNGVNLTVVVIPPDAYGAERATVAVADQPRLAVTVDGPSKAFGADRPATVNWSAIGSVEPAVALSYAAAISYAADVATLLRPATGPQDQA